MFSVNASRLSHQIVVSHAGLCASSRGSNFERTTDSEASNLYSLRRGRPSRLGSHWVLPSTLKVALLLESPERTVKSSVCS